MRAIYFYRVLTTFLLSLVFASTSAANNEYYQGENYFVTMVSKEVWDQQGTLATKTLDYRLREPMKRCPPVGIRRFEVVGFPVKAAEHLTQAFSTNPKQSLLVVLYTSRKALLKGYDAKGIPKPVGVLGDNEDYAVAILSETDAWSFDGGVVEKTSAKALGFELLLGIFAL